MYVPPGMTKDQVSKIIYQVADNLAFKFRFGYHEVDDIKQQIALFCIELLNKKIYDGKRPLENFLYIHSRNRLCNFKRDNFIRLDKPCLECPFYDSDLKESDSGCKQFSDVMECELYFAWITRNSAKKNLVDLLSIGTVKDEKEKNMRTTQDIATDVEHKAIFDILDENISGDFRKEYIKFKNGIHIQKAKRIRLYEIMKEILEQHGYVQEWGL